VTKQELLDTVWKGTAVTDNALTRVVAQLRRALGDDARQARYIETVPTRGDRFIAPLSRGSRARLEPPLVQPAAVPSASAPVAVAPVAVAPVGVGPAGVIPDDVARAAVRPAGLTPAPVAPAGPPPAASAPTRRTMASVSQPMSHVPMSDLRG
jgi:hypothetical protein